MITLDSRTRFLRACRGRSVDRTPVWFMRQAGRIFPAYRRLRQEYDFMTVCRTPDLSARVTCMPVEKLPVDAAIIFSDLMIPVLSLGIHFDMVPGTGPVIEDPIRSPSDVEALTLEEPEEQLEFVYEAIRATRDRLPPSIPLIGFAGAPFTLACYLIEGEPSRTFTRTKSFLFRQPEAWDRLMQRLSELISRYLAAQIEAGAETVQLFDTWVGSLSLPHFQHHVLPYIRSILEVIDRYDVPRIYFGTQTAGLLTKLEQTGADVLGLDWRTELGEAHRRFKKPMPLQGNLDPALMLAPFSRIKPDLDRLLNQARMLPGHVFNLGHGVLPDTPLDTLKRVIDYVHANTEREHQSQPAEENRRKP